jgi:hypothetical protein
VNADRLARIERIARQIYDAATYNSYTQAQLRAILADVAALKEEK